MPTAADPAGEATGAGAGSWVAGSAPAWAAVVYVLSGPAALGARDLGRARSWRGQGVTDTAIGKRLGVHGSTVARALAGVELPGSDPVAQAATLPVPAGA